MATPPIVECNVPDDSSLEVQVTTPVTVLGRPDITRVSSIQIQGPARVAFVSERSEEARLTILMVLLYGLFFGLERISLAFYLRHVFLRISRWASAQFMDCYVIAWIVVELVLYRSAARISLDVILALVVYRLIELTQAYTNIVIFQRLRHDMATLGPYRIVSHWRTFVIGVINLIEGALLFGLIYFVLAQRTGSVTGISSSWDALYFSFVTITTLGYGDIQPTGFARLLAAGEAVWGLLFGIALLGRFVAALPPDRALDESGT